MSLQLKREKLSSPNSQLKTPSISIVSPYVAYVDSIGMIDSCLFYPGDLIRIGSEVDGDLLLVRATHSTFKLLYAVVFFARRYGEFII